MENNNYSKNSTHPIYGKQIAVLIGKWPKYLFYALAIIIGIIALFYYKIPNDSISIGELKTYHGIALVFAIGALYCLYRCTCKVTFYTDGLVSRKFVFHKNCTYSQVYGVDLYHAFKYENPTQIHEERLGYREKQSIIFRQKVWVVLFRTNLRLPFLFKSHQYMKLKETAEFLRPYINKYNG